MIISAPVGVDEFEKYFALRWRILRQPWQQPLGSERDDLEDGSQHVMICDDDNQLMAVGRLHAASAQQGQIRYMAVETSAQGKGVGSALLEELERIARKQIFNSIVLHARETALPFYLHHGYAQIEKSHLLFNDIQHYKMLKHL